MAMPASLTSFTSPVVDKALETGARGSTTTTTNYGVIGDAFFKKAQLDLNIANLKADMGMQEAQLKSGLEMDRARLALEGANVMINAQSEAYRIKAEAKANEVSFGEALLGSVAGAAQGAAAGYQMSGGNPYGAAAGAALGGIATSQSYRSGRQSGQASVQMLGQISNAAGVMRGEYDKKASKDAWADYAKMGQTLYQQYQQTKPGSPERMEAEQKLNSHIASGTAVGASVGMNPQQSAETASAIRKTFETGSLSDDPKKRAAANIQEELMWAQKDELIQNPKKAGHREARNALLGRIAENYRVLNGEEMSEQAAIGYLDNVRPGMGSGKPTTTGIAGGTMTIPQRGGGGAVNSQMNPTQSTDIRQPSQERQEAPAGATVNGIAGGTIQLQPTRGVAMDDQQPLMLQQPAAAEQQLSKQGAETMEALGLNRPLTEKEKDTSGVITKDMTPNERHEAMKARKEKFKDEAPMDKVEKRSVEKFQQRMGKQNERIEKAKRKMENAGFAVTGSEDQYQQVTTASQSIDDMAELVANGSFPSNSQVKGMAADIREKGLPVGGIVGGSLGAIGGGVVGSIGGPAGAAGGAAKGAAVGFTAGTTMGMTAMKDMRVGKGHGMFLSDDEEAAVSEMSVLKKDVVPAFVRTQDPGSAVREFESAGYDDLLPDPRRSKEDNLLRLATLKEKLAGRIETAAEASSKKQSTTYDKELKMLQMKQNFESNPQKVYQEAIMRKQADEDFKKKSGWGTILSR